MKRLLALLLLVSGCAAQDPSGQIGETLIGGALDNSNGSTATVWVQTAGCTGALGAGVDWLCTVVADGGLGAGALGAWLCAAGAAGATEATGGATDATGGGKFAIDMSGGAESSSFPPGGAVRASPGPPGPIEPSTAFDG